MSDSDTNTWPKWLDIDWHNIMHYHGQGRLPHALAFSGPRGIGKRLFVNRLAQFLLCQNFRAAQVPNTVNLPCGTCKSCRLYLSLNHPDLALLEPESLGKAIGVDTVRDICIWSDNTSNQGGNKVVIIEPASDLNINSANALLKRLEEPQGNTFFLLLYSEPKSLIPTINSRCQKWELTKPDKPTSLDFIKQTCPNINDAQVQQVLSMAQGAPILAVKYAQDEAVAVRHAALQDLTALFRRRTHAVAVSEKWANNTELHLSLWSEWVGDLIRLMQTGQEQQVVNQDIIKLLHAIAKKACITDVFALYDNLSEGLYCLRTRRNLDNRLVLERLLSAWYNLV